MSVSPVIASPNKNNGPIAVYLPLTFTLLAPPRLFVFPPEKEWDLRTAPRTEAFAKRGARDPLSSMAVALLL